MKLKSFKCSLLLSLLLAVVSCKTVNNKVTSNYCTTVAVDTLPMPSYSSTFQVNDLEIGILEGFQEPPRELANQNLNNVVNKIYTTSKSGTNLYIRVSTYRLHGLEKREYLERSVIDFAWQTSGPPRTSTPEGDVVFIDLDGIPLAKTTWRSFDGLDQEWEMGAVYSFLKDDLEYLMSVKGSVENDAVVLNTMRSIEDIKVTR